MEACIEKCRGPELPQRILIRGVDQEKLHEKLEVITAISNAERIDRRGREPPIEGILIDNILDSNKQYNELDCDAKLPGIYERDMEFKSPGDWGECRSASHGAPLLRSPFLFHQGHSTYNPGHRSLDGYMVLYKMNEQICFTLRMQWGETPFLNHHPHHKYNHHLFMIDFFVQDDDYLKKWPDWYLPGSNQGYVERTGDTINRIAGPHGWRPDTLEGTRCRLSSGPVPLFPRGLHHLHSILPYIHDKHLLPLFHIWAMGEGVIPSFSDNLKWNINLNMLPGHWSHPNYGVMRRLDDLPREGKDIWGKEGVDLYNGGSCHPEYAIDNPYELPGFKVIPHDLEMQRLNLSKLLSERLAPDELTTQSPEFIQRIGEQLQLHKGGRRQKKRKYKKHKSTRRKTNKKKTNKKKTKRRRRRYTE